MVDRYDLSNLLRLTRDEITAHQFAKLKQVANSILGGNRFYQAKFNAAGIGPGDLRSPADLSRLPFTTKAELLEDQELHPPYGTNLTYPVERYTRLHQTSGTKGQALRWLDTPESWDWLLGLWKIIYAAGGVHPTDRFFFPFSFGPFLGFWAGFEAAVQQKHLTISGGAMGTDQRLKFILDNNVTVLACTPTYALHMAEAAKRQAININNRSVRLIIVAGEPGGNIPETKAAIESAWGARCIDHSGMTEIGSLGFEHIDHPGGTQLIETECIVEVINPDTCEPAPLGTRGELVLTNLGRLGSPLLRYRTGDLVQLATEPTPGLGSLYRLRGGILGRVDDMVFIRGNNLYPAALEAVLRRFPEVQEYRAEVRNESGLATLRLTIESSEELESNTGSLMDRVASAVREAFNFRPEVNTVGRGMLPRFEMKSSRFFIHPSYQKEPR